MPVLWPADGGEPLTPSLTTSSTKTPSRRPAVTVTTVGRACFCALRSPSRRTDCASGSSSVGTSTFQPRPLPPPGARWGRARPAPPPRCSVGSRQPLDLLGERRRRRAGGASERLLHHGLQLAKRALQLTGGALARGRGQSAPAR